MTNCTNQDRDKWQIPQEKGVMAMIFREGIQSSNNWIKRIITLIAIILTFFLVVYPFSNHSRGNAAADVSGNHSAVFPGIRPSDPFDFSGYIEVPSTGSLNPSGGHLTIEAWIKPNAENRNETIVGNGWKSSYWLGLDGNGQLRFTPYGSAGLVDSTGSIQAGVWNHVAVTYDGTTRSFYLNGNLDSQTNTKPGAIVPASPGQSLGIGFDREDTFVPNYFGGLIDNVRIWNVVRTESQIKNNMFQTFGSSKPGLISEWHLDGNANDPVGGFNGIIKGQVAFTNESAIPHDVPIPTVLVTPGLDGICNTGGEYVGATQVAVDNTSVWLMRTSDDLWICFDDLRASTVRAQVFLDVDYTRRDPAHPEHLLLGIWNNNTIGAWEGSGSGPYVGTNTTDGKWDGKFLVCCGDFPTYRAEYRISRDLIKGWHHAIGLALGKTDGTISSSKLWPALAEHNLPSTWSRTLGNINFYIPIVVK
jgi:hypothetical protein